MGAPWHAQAASRFSQDVEELSAPIAYLERDRKGVPILIKQFMKAGGRVLGFNIDPAILQRAGCADDGGPAPRAAADPGTLHGPGSRRRVSRTIISLGRNRSATHRALS
jgi:hypothetical protein